MNGMESPFLTELTKRERLKRRAEWLANYALVMTVAAVLGWTAVVVMIVMGR
jgi:hypothetical protein